MTRTRAFYLVTLVLWSSLSSTALFAEQGLAPSVQADLLRDKIYAQAKSNNVDELLKSLDQYHKLALQSGLVFPVPLYWIEAKAAHEAGDNKRAISALGEYLNHAERESSQYKEALSLYPAYEAAAGGDQKQQFDARREALALRIPAAMDGLAAALIRMQAGDLDLHVKGMTLQQDLVKINGSSKIPTFEIMQNPVSNQLWDVYCADVGCSSDDDWIGDNERKQFHTAKEVSDLGSWVSARLHQKWRLATESEIAYGAQLELEFEKSEGVKGSSVSLIGRRPGPDELQLVSSCWEPTDAAHKQGRVGSQYLDLTEHCDSTEFLLLNSYLSRVAGAQYYVVLSRESVPHYQPPYYSKSFVARLVREQ